MRAKYSIEFWIALPKKIDKVLATHKRLFALICNILGWKKKTYYEMFNKLEAEPPNHEPSFRPDKSRA